MCHQLTSLELMSNTLISDTEICVFIHTTGLNLKHLNLSDTSVGNRTVRKILTTCSKLETLDLSSYNGVTTEAFDPSDLQCKATGVASINLSGCEMVEYSVINYLVGLFPKIIQHDLKCNSVITPEVFSKLTNYPELKRKILRFGSIGIDDGVTFLCKSRLSKKLEEIDFHENSNITDKSENYGKFFCQFEIELVLNGCNNVPPDANDLSRKLLSLNGGKGFYEFRE
ncbi:8327_t:CDS:2 [Entrophospora sp. SA101]|nr:4887_t:CDS:2 [Entrophospora sp. SA101]CAJ0897350.1 8327_t:CDS:2 [Entrophospora sp. SA101]